MAPYFRRFCLRTREGPRRLGNGTGLVRCGWASGGLWEAAGSLLGCGRGRGRSPALLTRLAL